MRQSRSQSTPKRTLSEDTAFRMGAFGMGVADLDSEGLVTLYHGGKELPKTLRSGEILFLTPSEEEAKDYARMRKGQVFILRVDPERVSWNTGSQEVEFDLGGIIRDGVIIPPVQEKVFEAREGVKETYKGIGVGHKMPRTGWVVQDLVLEPSPQFLLEGRWHAAFSVLEYEYPDGGPEDAVGPTKGLRSRSGSAAASR